MSDKTKIQWTSTENPDGSFTPGATLNCITGCDRVSSGCAQCYAVGASWRMGHNSQPAILARYGGTVERQGNGVLDWTGVVKCHPEQLLQFARWTRPRRIFVNSLSDTFHPAVPDRFLDQLFDAMIGAPQHIYQLLTKRPENMRRYTRQWCDAHSVDHLPGHIWCGTSVENESVTARIAALIGVPAQTRFLSMEPLLGPVSLAPYLDCWGESPISWVIIGGESGPHARPLDLAWIRNLIQQCATAHVACFVKQLGSVWADDQNAHMYRTVHAKGGEPSEWPDWLQVRQFPASFPQEVATP